MSAPVVDITARLHAERDELRDRVTALEFELALTQHITRTMFRPGTEPSAAEAMLSVVPSQLIRALRKGTPSVHVTINNVDVTVTLTPGLAATSEEIVAAWIGLLETHRAVSGQAPAGTVFVTRAPLPAHILRAEWENATGDRVIVTAITPVTSTPTRPQRRLRVVAPLAEETQ
jgi:hypothetical protein